MIILEIIAEFIIEVIFIELVGGTLSRLNNGILKLRGIETRTIEEIKFEKFRKRYEYKSVITKAAYGNINKGTKGTVLELIDSKIAFVEFKGNEEVIQIPLKQLLIKNSIN